jgi:hypothetical protein
MIQRQNLNSILLSHIPFPFIFLQDNANDEQEVKEEQEDDRCDAFSFGFSAR